MKDLLLISLWTGLFCLTLVAFAEAKGRRPKLPDLLLRNFINMRDISEVSTKAQQSLPGVRGGRPGSTDVNMTEIDEILQDKYGLTNTTISQGSARFMLEVYRKLEEGESLVRASGHRGLDVAILQADTVRSFPNKERTRGSRDKMELTFRLAGISEEEVTKRAELRVRSLPTRGRHVYKVKVTVIEGGVRAQRLSYRVSTKRSAKDGSAVIDLTTIVQDVLEAGYRDATLHFTLRPAKSHTLHRGARSQVHQQEGSEEHEESSSGVHLTGSVMEDHPGTRSKRDVSKNTAGDAMLVIFTKNKQFFSKFTSDLRIKADQLKTKTRDTTEQPEAGSERVKRRSSKSPETSKAHKVGGSCRKLDFAIDFEVIGWDKWIVYPKKFNAYRCGGKCKNTRDPDVWPTNHAILQSLMNRRDRKLAPRPCCVPSKLRPISMLYFEEDEIVVRQHVNMVVDQCSCS